MSFDRLATHYRWLEVFLAGGKMQRCRLAFLDRVREANSALLVGEGNGRFLVPFLLANQKARVVCLEESGRMIDCARRSMQRHELPLDRVEFQQANVRMHQPPKDSFDLIVSHFFLDCFTEPQLQVLVPALAQSGQAECTWLLADFQEPAKGLPRLRAKIVLKMMYSFFRTATDLPADRITPPDALLRRSGFRLATRTTADWGLLHSDYWIRDRRLPIRPESSDHGQNSSGNGARAEKCTRFPPSS